MARLIPAVCAAIAALTCVCTDATADDVKLPDRQKVHVYLLLGQSNMAGRGKMTDADREPVDGVVMMDKQDRWVPARHPIHFDKSIAAVGLGMSFAESMRDHAKKGVTIALVPCAVGGTPLERWQKGGDLYQNAVRRAQIAAKDGVLMGALWHQGEADSGSEERSASYAKRLDRMIRDLRRDVGDPRLPFVAGELIPSFVAKSKHADRINAAVMGLPTRVMRTAGVSAHDIGHKDGDTTHTSADGLREFGRRYAAALVAIDELGGASNPRVNNLKPERPGGQVKRQHPHALKMILLHRDDEARAYLNDMIEEQANPEHTQLLVKMLDDAPDAWQYDAETWPWERAMPRTDLKQDAPVDRFAIAFGGGAGYVPVHERMWDTIRGFDPRAVLLMGDNVYIDDPECPEEQRFHYYRRQSRPEWARLVKQIPVYSIWDDHDFSTNDSWGGPDVDTPAWKRAVWEIYKENWDNPAYGGGDEHPGCWYDFRLGDVHFIMLDCRYYRENPRADDPSMLGPVQLQWLKKTLAESDATFKVIASSVPWAPNVKPGSKDTWDGYPGERRRIFDFIAAQKVPGVVLLSADRHRSDAYRIERPDDVPGAYDLYEFSSSKLTNQHTHELMDHALFGYNGNSFGLVEFDLTAADPTVRYRIIDIDGKQHHELTLKLSQLRPPAAAE